MKGMWDSSKSVDTTYRPALDALSAVDASLLARAILLAVSDGGGLMFSATRDYGAICLTLLQGDQRHKVYPSDVQALAQALSDLCDSLEAPPNTARRAPKRT